jgi:hypothetical protein
MKAVNSDAGLAWSPGFSGQREIEPGRDEENEHTDDNMPKLQDKSA